MIIRAELAIEQKKKIRSGTTFSGQYSSYPKYGVTGTVKGDRLIIETTDSYCRDHVIPYFAAMFREFYDRYPEKQLSAYGNLAFEVERGNKRDPGANEGKWPYKTAIQEVLGRRRISPLVSPYILRYVLGRSRGTNANGPQLDWFLEMMQQAREQKIDFNRNLFESWALDMKTKAEFQTAYGFMGLDALLRNKTKPVVTAGTPWRLTVPDYELVLVFPPAKLL